MRVLLVTDDVAWAFGMNRDLKKRNVSVDMAELDIEADDPRLTERDVLLLKPKEMSASVWAACVRLGGRPDAALLLFQVSRDDNDYVAALDLGADDCLAPDMATDALVARLRALRRRLRAPESPDSSTRPPGSPAAAAYSIDGWRFTPATSELLAPSGRIHCLSRNDQQILLSLLSEPGRFFSVADLSRRWRTPDARHEDWRVYVHRLRAKLLRTEPDVGWLRSVRGQGYALVGDVRLEQGPPRGRVQMTTSAGDYEVDLAARTHVETGSAAAPP